MIVSVFVLFVLYSVACILDGPDMGNGDIIGFLRKIAASQLLTAAKRADRKVFYSMFKPPVMPNYPSVEVRELEQRFGISFSEVNLEMYRYRKSCSDEKEASVMIFKQLLERSVNSFGKDLANLIVSSRAFKCRLEEPTYDMPLRFTFSVPIAVQKKESFFEHTVSTSVCDVTMSEELDLKEVLEYMAEGGPFVNPFKR